MPDLRAESDLPAASQAQIPPTDRLLCQLLRLDDGWRAALEQAGDSDWEPLAGLARRYSLADSLYYRLKASPAWPGIPETVRSQLSSLHLENAAGAILRQHRLKQVLRALVEAGVPIIVLKGAFLAEAIYPRASSRAMGDVDLLAPLAQIDQAVEVLRSIGYQSSIDHSALEDFHIHHHAPPFIQPGFPTIELHWKLTTQGEIFQVDLDGLWQRAQPAVIASAPVLGLAPEDLLLHLCIHAVRNRLASGLRAAFDVAVVLERYQAELDWPALERRAEQWLACRSLYLMLGLARELFGAPLSAAGLAAFQAQARDPAPLDLAYPLIFFQNTEPVPVFIPIHMVRLQNTPGLRAKLRLLAGRFFPPVTDFTRRFGVSQNSWQVWLYYPVRWWELFVQNIALLWKFWRGDSRLHKQARIRQDLYDQQDALFAWLAKQPGEKR